MSSPFVAEIRLFAGNFAPSGWALCNGQLLPMSQNTALFALLGTTFGGDGDTTFALPDLQGRTPMGWGQGPGLSLRERGEQVGARTVTLLESEIPAHTHQASGVGGVANQLSPANNAWGGSAQLPYAPAATASGTMNAAAISTTGGGQPHNNMPPYLSVTMIIALQGTFPPPPRS